METKLCLCSPEIVNVVIMGEICTSVEGPLNAPPPPSLSYLPSNFLWSYKGVVQALV